MGSTYRIVYRTITCKDSEVKSLPMENFIIISERQICYCIYNGINSFQSISSNAVKIKSRDQIYDPLNSPELEFTK